jgi:hypothetical protein
MISVPTKACHKAPLGFTIAQTEMFSLAFAFVAVNAQMTLLPVDIELSWLRGRSEHAYGPLRWVVGGLLHRSFACRWTWHDTVLPDMPVSQSISQSAVSCIKFFFKLLLSCPPFCTAWLV